MSKTKGKAKVEDIVRELAAPICEELQCEIFDIEYKKEGSDWYLRLYIDRSEPVDHDLCYAVSQRLSDALDAADPIPDAYFLEVSSPGIERPLRNAEDYQRYIGETVMLKLFAAQNGKKEFVGRLLGFDGSTVSIECMDKNKAVKYELPLDSIANAHLFFE